MDDKATLAEFVERASDWKPRLLSDSQLMMQACAFYTKNYRTRNWPYILVGLLQVWHEYALGNATFDLNNLPNDDTRTIPIPLPEALVHLARCIVFSVPVPTPPTSTDTSAGALMARFETLSINVTSLLLNKDRPKAIQIIAKPNMFASI